MINLKQFVSREKLWITFIVFYCVGLGMFMLPATRSLFIHITPFTLLLTAFAVFYYHRNWTLKTALVFLFIYLTSFFAEVLGVVTGKIFGVYSYGIGLGIKVFDVPLLIGLNWVVLIYITNAIVSHLSKNKLLIVGGGAFLMLAYDYVLEYAAPYMSMWKFEGIRPPFDNYLVWFILSLVFHFTLVLFKTNTNNKPARKLYVVQLAFFVLIVIYSLLFLK